MFYFLFAFLSLEGSPLLPSVSTCTALLPIDPRPGIGSAHTPASCPSVPLELLFLITATRQVAQISSLVLSPLLGHRPLSCIIAGDLLLPSCLYPPILPSVSLTDSATTSLHWVQASPNLPQTVYHLSHQGSPIEGANYFNYSWTDSFQNMMLHLATWQTLSQVENNGNE